MDFKMLVHWAIARVFGLRDLPKLIAKGKNASTSASDWGTIRISKDHEIESWTERVDNGSGHSAWQTTKLFIGTEREDFGAEYWLCTQVFFLAAVLPVKVCIKKTVIKLGKSCDAFNACNKEHGHCSMSEFKHEYSHKIIQRASIDLHDSGFKMNDCEVWATYD